MLAPRIIPCLDVRDGKVVKGIQFQQHRIMGDIVDLAAYYSQTCADELVFYDITASSEHRSVDSQWIEKVASKINIPFCVAGGIRTIEQARLVLHSGADKVSINTPAVENPDLIEGIAKVFGSQCVVVGVDSRLNANGEYYVWKATGSEKTAQQTTWKTMDWISQLKNLGAGEIVLNCMNVDGIRQGYDIKQLQLARDLTSLPLIASGGAGNKDHFVQLFQNVSVNGALAATIFHSKQCKT